MPPSDSFIKGTQEFWEARTGEPISSSDASEAAGNAVSFLNLLAEWDRDAENAKMTSATKEGVEKRWENGRLHLTVRDGVSAGGGFQL